MYVKNIIWCDLIIETHIIKLKHLFSKTEQEGKSGAG
jgi:hypothetical protein